jgi:hypothetical protein
MTDDMDSLWINDGTDPLDTPEAPEGPLRSHKAPLTTEDNHIGCPMWWLEAVYPIMHGKAELAVALFLYRRRVVEGCRTISFANCRLGLGVSRFTKYRALKALEDAGLVTVRHHNKRAPEVTFCRRPRKKV